MMNYASQLLLGIALALSVGAAGAQSKTDSYSNSRLPSAKGAVGTIPAQPADQPTDKMSNERNAATAETTAQRNDAEPAQTAPVRHARKSAMRQREAVSPEEKSYRGALRECVKQRDESQRDSCLASAIDQHQPNG